MSTPAKLRGAGSGKQSELTRLKALTPQERAEIYAWRSEQPTPTNAEIRTRLGERFGIALRRDSQLSEFWQWQFRQAPIDHLGEMMEQDEQLLSDKFPQFTRDQLREITIKRGYALADKLGDVELGLKVVSADLKDKTVEIDTRKLAVLERKADQADQAKEVAASELTPEEKAARMKQIFGM